MAYVIFDLDGTVLDSSHRHATNADGSLDLKHWLTNARPEKIRKDTLLPLARSMRAIHKAGHVIIVCTSRCMQAADFKLLADRDLPYDVLFSRPGRIVQPDEPEFEGSFHGFIGDARSDELIKAEQLDGYFRSLGYANAAAAKPIMFDDNLKVIQKMNSIGINCFNAVTINSRMRPIAA